MNITSDEFRFGFRAAQDGLLIQDNPYLPEEQEYLDWVDGFNFYHEED